MNKLLISMAAFALLTPCAPAQNYSYGSISPKSQSIELWSNTSGTCNNPIPTSKKRTIKAGPGDSQHFVTVSNRNVKVAVTPGDQLANFMAGSGTTYKTHDFGFGAGNPRKGGAQSNVLSLGNGTVVGFGVRPSAWSNYKGTNAETGFLSFLYADWAYQPGTNPKVNQGNYSSKAWVRKNRIGSFSVNEASLDVGKGAIRRWTIGEFTTAIDSSGKCPERYVFTTADNLTAFSSGIWIIAVSDKAKFMKDGSGTKYAKLFNTSLSQEVTLPPGRIYCFAVQDGKNSSSQTWAQSTGAQVVVYGYIYQ